MDWYGNRVLRPRMGESGKNRLALDAHPFVGTGYFDLVQSVVTAGMSSTTAMSGSTEEEQFEVGAVAN